MNSGINLWEPWVIVEKLYGTTELLKKRQAILIMAKAAGFEILDTTWEHTLAAHYPFICLTREKIMGRTTPETKDPNKKIQITYEQAVEAFKEIINSKMNNYESGS